MPINNNNALIPYRFMPKQYAEAVKNKVAGILNKVVYVQFLIYQELFNSV